MINGSYLRKLRKSHNYTLIEFSQEIGCTASFLSQLERGQKEPSLTTLRKLSEVLGVPIASFFLPEEEPVPKVSPAANICNMWHLATYEFLEKAGFLEFVDTMTCKIFTSADTEEKYNVALDVGINLLNRWRENEDKWCDGKQDGMDAIIYLALLDAWRVYCKQDKKQREIEEDEGNED